MKKDENENFLVAQNLATKEILSFKEALVYLDVSKSKLYKLTSGREIKYSKPNNGKLYFKKVDLDDWMLQNEFVTKSVLEEIIVNKISKNGKKIN